MRLILSLFFLISANVFGDISVCQNCKKKSCFELQDKQARIECNSLQKYKQILIFPTDTTYIYHGWTSKDALTWSNDSRYEGGIKEGLFHGKGIATYADGSSYDGEWKDGQRHGKGIATYADDYSYDGEWKDNKRHGKGILNPPHISVGWATHYDGIWEYGEMTKHGRHSITIFNGL